MNTLTFITGSVLSGKTLIANALQAYQHGGATILEEDGQRPSKRNIQSCLKLGNVIVVSLDSNFLAAMRMTPDRTIIVQ